MTRRLKGSELLDQRRHNGVYTRALLGFGSKDNGIRDIAEKIKQRREAAEHRTRSEIVREIARIEIETARLEVGKESLTRKAERIKGWKIVEVVLESIEYDLNRVRKRAAKIEDTVKEKFRRSARLNELDELIISGNTDEIIRRAYNFGGSSVITSAMAKISYHRGSIEEEKRTEMMQQLGLANEKFMRSNDKRHRSLSKRINARKDYQEVLTYLGKLEAHATIARREVSVNNQIIEDEIRDLDQNFDQVSRAMIAGTAMYLIRTRGLDSQELERTIAAASVIVKLENEIDEINRKLEALKSREIRLLEIAKQE